MSKVCLVTGASAGIGRAIALELLRAGHTVHGLARRVERMDDLARAGGHPIGADVTGEADVERAVASVLDAHGRVDVLVNNAGSVVHGAAEDVPIGRARDVFEVNLFGPARLTRLVLPHMRERRSGTIVNISSIAGEIALPLGAWYAGGRARVRLRPGGRGPAGRPDRRRPLPQTAVRRRRVRQAPAVAQ